MNDLTECREDIVYFSVDGTGIGAKVQRLVSEVLEKAKRENVDILVFPEMIGNAMLIKKTAEYLQDYFIEGFVKFFV